jgi:hypothetical protein
MRSLPLSRYGTDDNVTSRAYHPILYQKKARPMQLTMPCSAPKSLDDGGESMRQLGAKNDGILDITNVTSHSSRVGHTQNMHRAFGEQARMLSYPCYMQRIMWHCQSVGV